MKRPVSSFHEAEEGGLQYSSVIIRSLINGASLHPDFAPFLKIDWCIKYIVKQLAWNIYLDMPESGGETVVFNKQWELSDNKYIQGDSYAYDRQVVAGAQRDSISANVGT